MSTIMTNELSRAELVTRYGSSASIALLDPVCEVFRLPHISGAIGYRQGPGCYIVYGEPIAHPDDWAELTEAFHHFCKTQNMKIVYATTSSPFTTWAINHVCGALIEIGEELIMDPQVDPSVGSKGRIIRKKLNHSKEVGVTVEEYIPHDPLLELAMENVGETWLNDRDGPQIFLSHIQLFGEREGKRWFYALHEKKIVGVLALNKLEAQNGWLVNLLMVTPSSPNGTSERLIITALEALRSEGCRFLSFGVTPTETLGEIKGLGRFSSWIARTTFKTVRRLFRLDGRRDYWLKFQPKGEPAYILFSHDRIGITEILGLMKAFNAGF